MWSGWALVSLVSRCTNDVRPLTAHFMVSSVIYSCACVIADHITYTMGCVVARQDRELVVSDGPDGHVLFLFENSETKDEN